LTAWVELINREAMRTNSVKLDILRAAKSDAKGFKAFSKKLTEMGA